MNKICILLGALLLSTAKMTAQIDKSIRLNEIMTSNSTSLQDEYGERDAWIEIVNTSFSTYNIRGMFITTDRSVLNKTMSVPERMKRMSIIPNGESRTSLSARQHIVFFLNSQPHKGSLHLNTKINASQPTWIALYNGNATQLLDSVTIPVIASDQTFARRTDGTGAWAIVPADCVTPGISNFTQANESKIDKFKREDPYGFAMAIMAMGIVFFCLALLFVFFSIFGTIMKHQETARKVANTQPIKPITKTVEKTIEVGHKTGIILQDGLKLKGIEREVYMAVIAMALKQYEDDVHDVESGVITIKPKDTDWNDETYSMRQFHE